MLDDHDIGISTSAYWDLPLPEALARIAELAPAAEIYSHGHHSLLERRNVRAVAKAGLPFSVHGPFRHCDIGSPRELQRRACIRRHRNQMKVAAALGATLYIVHPDMAHQPEPRTPQVVDALQHSFQELRRLQERYGLPVAIENMPHNDHSHFTAPGDLDLQGLGLVLDAGHAALTGTLSQWLSEPQAPLVHVHLHDNQGAAHGDLHLPLGAGVIDAGPVLLAARAAGASITFELTSEADVLASLEHLRSRGLLSRPPVNADEVVP